MIRYFILGSIILLSLMACSQTNTLSKANPSSEDLPPAQQSKSTPLHQTTTSSIDPEFPIPEGAKKSDKKSNDPQTSYVRYDFTGLTDPTKRQNYFEQIKKAGWTEHPDEQMGSMHIFTKGNKRLQVIIHDDYFTLSIPKAFAE
ncbi:hypothetical protein SAMN05444392_10262 [Seinonella peptonophila]|uniref:Lipoprotein n=1 Tax=Seinonella peptonophila TaxID=112248 RepID=A0A1M4UWY2_9BACL|nr:hypothetical protein [Seinonella peptonophila]SHE61188.1 hypothetical protein SAMN05444392_10262 [Seinonella peptonophila]